MARRTILPYGPQHPVLPEPIHLDLVLEDERVVEAVPRIGFVHRGLEKLTDKYDYQQYDLVAERICGICSFGHSLGYAQATEHLVDVEIPPRAQVIRVIYHELERMQSDMLWLGLLADALGFESLFMHCWRLREQLLDYFEATCGGRIILSLCCVGGLRHDVDTDQIKGVVTTIEDMRDDLERIQRTFLRDRSVVHRMEGIGMLSAEDALAYGAVGPVLRGSGVALDMRMLDANATDGTVGYTLLDGFEPITATGGDCLARCEVRLGELFQSIDIVEQLVQKIPEGEFYNKPKGDPADADGICRIEQPRGEAFYYCRGNGSKHLTRFRMRTPTTANLASLVHMLQGVELTDVATIILTIDPCISCNER